MKTANLITAGLLAAAFTGCATVAPSPHFSNKADECINDDMSGAAVLVYSKGYKDLTVPENLFSLSKKSCEMLHGPSDFFKDVKSVSYKNLRLTTEIEYKR